MKHLDVFYARRPFGRRSLAVAEAFQQLGGVGESLVRLETERDVGAVREVQPGRQQTGEIGLATHWIPPGRFRCSVPSESTWPPDMLGDWLFADGLRRGDRRPD